MKLVLLVLVLLRVCKRLNVVAPAGNKSCLGELVRPPIIINCKDSCGTPIYCQDPELMIFNARLH